MYTIDFFVSDKSTSFLETWCLENQLLLFSSSNQKIDPCIHNIEDVLSPISKLQSSDLILFYRISNHIIITSVINYSILMWSLPLHSSRITHCHVCPIILKSPRPCSHAFTIIIWLGELKVIRFTLTPYEATFKIYLHSLRSWFTLFGTCTELCAFHYFIYSSLILFVKLSSMKNVTFTVSSILVADCSCLKPTVFLLITVSTWYYYAMNLCKWNLEYSYRCVKLPT